MMFYILYMMGYGIANIAPLPLAYRIANFIADIYYAISIKDRRSLINNLTVISNGKDTETYERMARDVFRNFAKYLVDFFRFGKVDRTFVDSSVKVEGLNNLADALRQGKGVIVLSAHLGNWELGGAVLSILGYPVKAIAVKHQNKNINKFFDRQRLRTGMRVIPIGPALKQCFTTLRSNGILAILGDRDFSTSGVRMKLFGKETILPTGPAEFSHVFGSAIVPVFVTREPDDTFRVSICEPLYPSSRGRDTESIKKDMSRYIAVIERFVRQYPSQWYMFREVWNNGKLAEPLRLDSIV